MKKQFKFQNLMEALAEDENKVQDFVQDYNKTLVGDWLQPGSRRRFRGFTVERKNASTVTVGEGRLYADRQMYDRPASGDVDLSQHFPAAAKRIVALVIYGREIEASPDVRDFLISVDSDEMQPKPVELEIWWEARVQVVAGLEAAAPQPPAIDANYAGLAYITLTPAGIASAASIERLDDNEIDNLVEAFDLINDLVESRRKLAQVVDALRSDVADFAKQLQSLRSNKALLDVATDVARLKEVVGLPDNRTAYHADRFLTVDETDAGFAGYDAQISEGLRFAPANISENPLALLDPLDAAVDVTAAGMILPKSNDKIIVSIGDKKAERTGEIAIANYATTTFTGRQLRLARARVRYGEEFRVSAASSWWDSGRYDPIANIFQKSGETFEVVEDRGLDTYSRLRVKRYWTDIWNDDEYWAYTSNLVDITGKVLAQSYLNSSGKWIKAVRLRCTRKGAAGDVSVVVTRTVNGVPDRDQILAVATLQHAQLVEGGWSRFAIEPTWLRRGDRIAIHVVTVGDHWFQTADGEDYAAGSLFAYADGDYALALPGKTLCFELVQAEFTANRTVVALQPWSLDGGVASIDILAGMTMIQRDSLYFEFKIGSKWTRIDDPKNGLTALAQVNPLPPLIPARLVMTHTADIAPAVVLAGSRVRLTRPKTALRHISDPCTLPAGVTTTSVRVQLRVSEWNAAAHEITARLLTGAGYATVVAAASQTNAATSDGQRLITAVFTLGSPVGAYRVRIDGATTAAIDVFVIDERIDVSF